MKTALVTGAAKRIGQAIAMRLLDEGYQLLLHAHTSMDELRAWVDAHEHRDQVIALCEADLATERGQVHLVERTHEAVTCLDLVVHNASQFFPQPFSEVDRQSFREMLAINLEAPYFISQGLLPLLNRSAQPSILNIVDAMWERPSANYSHYAVSKAGLAILTRSLAIELAPHIRVNGVAPGAIMFQPFHSDVERERTINKILLKRLGSPEDVADAVFYLAAHANYVTGEIYFVDGGRAIA